MILWILMTFYIHWGCMSTAINCQISFLVVSSREFPIGRAIVKIRIFCFAMSQLEHLITTRQKEILKLIEDVNKKYGNTVIMVTHNEAIRHMADHVIKLRDGSVRHNDINEQKGFGNGFGMVGG